MPARGSKEAEKRIDGAQERKPLRSSPTRWVLFAFGYDGDDITASPEQRSSRYDIVKEVPSVALRFIRVHWSKLAIEDARTAWWKYCAWRSRQMTLNLVRVSANGCGEVKGSHLPKVSRSHQGGIRQSPHLCDPSAVCMGMCGWLVPAFTRRASKTEPTGMEEKV